MDPNPVTLNDLIQIYKRQLSDQQLTLTVFDASTRQQHTVAYNSKNSFSVHKVVYDPQCSLNPSCYEDNYYCNNLEDLNLILQFMSQHPDIFVYHNTNDMYDHCEVVAFTKITSL